MSRWLVVFLVASLSVLAVPTGSAQWEPIHDLSAQVWVTPYHEQVEPIRGTGHALVTVDVRCGPFGVAPLDPVPVELHLKVGDPWVSATISPQTTMVQFPPEGCMNGHEERIRATVEFAFTKDAPAFERTTFTVWAIVPYADHARAEWQQMAGQYFHTAARAEETVIHAAANQHVQVPLTIENHGNGPIVVRFRLDEQSPQDLAIALPPQMVVPAFGGVTTANVDINTPFGFDGTRQDVTALDVLPASADDVELHDAPIQLSATIVTQGDGGSGGLPAEELPAPGFVAPLVALAAIGALMRRRF